MKGKVLTGLLILLLGLVQISWAGDFASSLNASIKSYPPTVNIAGSGGFWSALPNPFSSNPATFTTLKKYGFNGAVYTSYNLIDFKSGPNFDPFVVGTGLMGLGKGVLRIGYANFDTDKAKTKVFGLKGNLQGEILEIGYGYPINERLSLGLTFIPIYSSDVEFEAEVLGKQITVAKGKNRAREDFRLGLLYNPLDWLYLGLTYEHNRDKLETTTLTLFEDKKTTEYPTIDLIRPGLVIQPWRGGTIGVDWLWGKINNKKGKDDYDIDQLFFGIEQYLNPRLCLRVGSADGGFTAGLGLRWTNLLLGGAKPINLLLDYTYLDKSMKDMKPHLGSSATHLVAITIAW